VPDESGGLKVNLGPNLRAEVKFYVAEVVQTAPPAESAQFASPRKALR